MTRRGPALWRPIGPSLARFARNDLFNRQTMADSLFTFTAPTSYGQSTEVFILTAYAIRYGVSMNETISYGSYTIDFSWTTLYMHPVILYFTSGNYYNNAPSMSSTVLEPECGRTLTPASSNRTLVSGYSNYGTLYIIASSTKLSISVEATSGSNFHGWALNLLIPIFFI